MSHLTSMVISTNVWLWIFPWVSVSPVYICNLLMRCCSLVESIAFSSAVCVNVRMYMSGHFSSHSRWNEMKFPKPPSASLLSQEKNRKTPPTLCENLSLTQLDWRSWITSHCYAEVADLSSTCTVIPLFCASLKVFEKASEDHGGWNSSHLQSHPRGFWELHMHANQWPADLAHCLRQPHSDAYVYYICAWSVVNAE